MQYLYTSTIRAAEEEGGEMKGGGGRASQCTAQRNANFAGKLYFVPLCSKSCKIIHTSI